MATSCAGGECHGQILNDAFGKGMVTQSHQALPKHGNGGLGLRPIIGIWPQLTLHINRPWIPFLIWSINKNMEAQMVRGVREHHPPKGIN